MEPEDILNITLVQPNLVWEDKSSNLKHLDVMIRNVGETDLIVLPEMFSTGFSMRSAELAEAMNGATVDWMRGQAAKHNAVVTGSLIVEEKGNYFNRLIWMSPDGEFEWYDKRHLFSFANEHTYYTAGKRRLISFLKGWRICPLICYDLRFPVWIRNATADDDFAYDLLLFVANWPEVRSSAWRNLLEARAHENQAYVAGVNRVGKDGNGIYHSGDSAMLSPRGELLSDFKRGEEAVKTFSINAVDLKTYRSKFTAWKDRDKFTLDH